MNSSRAATEVHFRPSALAGATSSFVLIGATAAMYGPLLISFSHKFHLSLPTTGAVISVSNVPEYFSSAKSRIVMIGAEKSTINQ